MIGNVLGPLPNLFGAEGLSVMRRWLFEAERYLWAVRAPITLPLRDFHRGIGQHSCGPCTLMLIEGTCG